jgi:hypothetical protein
MTDWTTPEDVPADTVDRLHRWLLQEGNPEDAATPGERAVADIIRTFWPVPAPTIAEELRAWAEDASYDEDRDNLLHAASRAEQIEEERDEARAEVERLTAERLDRNPETKARVEAALNNLDNAERVTVQKGAESNAESLTAPSVKHSEPSVKCSDATVTDPADVPPGEAWLVRDKQELSVAVRDAERWVLIRLNDVTTRYRGIQHITLVSRLVPAPRVITDPDELDKLAEGSIVMSDGWGWYPLAEV